ncbi:helix-turn-helix domain-containing protein [Sulfitobacter sp. W002]|uniref:helix-turn-helix domain-containing protein n=1 Tax=Sulfitobacter sp. W002 TaxID=2867024 RepID=UPI0021A77547|nr:helix-turn-helix domain-containing protein [Sulfitobacter sp. W002]UWR29662.1 helix-turn-helix domain-containing protein [Sulfitobacter sp. W002]
MKKHAATPQILAALKRGERITAHDALARWGIFRLAVIIHHLRQAGHDVKTNMIYRAGTRYGEYYI